MAEEDKKDESYFAQRNAERKATDTPEIREQLHKGSTIDPKYWDGKKTKKPDPF